MSYDVAIIGAGTAGAAAATACAEKGLKVIALERGPLGQAGARWVNGVQRRTFAEAGYDEPSGAEHLGISPLFHMVAGWGPTRVIIPESDMIEVDMRLLVERLHARATRAGAEIRGSVRVQGITGETVHTDGEDIQATWIVDASGIAGLRSIMGDSLDAVDICVAAQQVHQVTDVPAAHAWCRKQGIEPGQVVCFAGVSGGYSILNIRVHNDEVSILAGSIPGLGNKPGGEMLDQFVDDTPWIGRCLFGGRRAIPLMRPPARIYKDNVAAIGDSASMVYGPHGSGIGQQLLASRTLADALSAGEGVIGYNRRWQKQHGGLLASADLFRRFSQSLSVDEFKWLLERNVLSQNLLLTGIQQRPARPTPTDMAQSLRGLAKLPRLAARLGPVLARIPLVELHYSRYPDDPAQIDGWYRRLQLISGLD